MIPPDGTGALTAAAAALTLVAIALLAWTYVLYPLAIVLVARLRPRAWRSAPFDGSVSLVIPAHNEAAVLERKIRNALALDFGGASAHEIIVVSDGSTDGTDEILDAFRDHPAARDGRLTLIAYAPRRGKPSALDVGVRASSGDVLVLSDANVYLERGAVPALLAPLADAGVGAVCGRVAVRSRGAEPDGEGFYVRYEGLAWRAEARAFSAIGVDGALYALRREHYRALPPDMILDDFALSMGVVSAGRRIAYADDARGIEENAASSAGEFKRKKRIVGGGWQFLSRFLAARQRLPGVAWFMLVSHKLLRWLSPLLLIAALAGNAVAAVESPAFRLLLWAQAGFYLLALAGAAPALRRMRVVFVPFYFCVINMAALAGLASFLGRRQTALWHKIER